MRKAAIILCATAVLFAAPAAAKPEQDAQACLTKALHNDSELSLLTKQIRNRLIRNPGEIASVIEMAAAADTMTKAKIELGIVQAVAYLKCVDQAGYQALTDYLKTHADNPVVADIEQALSALAQAGPGAGAPAAAPGGGGGFSSGGGAPVSLH